MCTSLSKLALFALLGGALLAGNAAAAEKLRLGGTGTATGMLKHVGAVFAAANPVQFEVIPGLGSSGAIQALADGKLDIAVSARPLKANEIAAGLKQVALLRTAFVLATSQRNPNGFKTANLVGVFSSSMPTWADGTPIRVILRPRSETDTALLGQMAPGMDKAIEAMRLRPEIPVAATDQDNADMAERTPGSLTGTTMTQLKAENRRLQIVRVDEVEPTTVNVETGAYPFWKKLHFILRPNGSAVAQQFMEFLRSLPGEKALREVDVLPWSE